MTFDEETLRYRGPDATRCFELFSSLRFRTLLADYAPTASTVDTDYAIVRSEADLEATIRAVRDAGRCGLHVLADSLDAMRSVVVGVALSAAPRHGRYVPLRHQAFPTEPGLDPATGTSAPPTAARRPGGAQGWPRPEGGCDPRTGAVRTHRLPASTSTR